MSTFQRLVAAAATILLAISGSAALALSDRQPAETISPQEATGDAVKAVTTAAPETTTATSQRAAPPADAGRSATAPGRVRKGASGRLVADAGDSGNVQVGENVILLGTQYGGQAPFTYEWKAQAGWLLNQGNPTAVIATSQKEGDEEAGEETKITSGLYTATLTVTDATGAKATDTVLYRVHAEPEAIALLPRTEPQADGPGSSGVPDNGPTWEFEVPAGTSRIDASIFWGNPANDYDIQLMNCTETGEDGEPVCEEAAYNGDFVPDDTETAAIVAPDPGLWKLTAYRFATTADPGVSGEVLSTEALAADPRPTVDAGGNDDTGSVYRFVDGAPQRLVGSVKWGSRPYQRVGWDLDLDGGLDVKGAEVTTKLPAGRHLVAFKVTDARGYERRELTTVFVGTKEEVRDQAVPLTVIGIADTGLNPYHMEFSAAAYPDPEVLELTRNFTRHPSEYIPGFPKDAKPIPITNGEGYFPEKDTFLWKGNDHVKAGELYWIPGTKVIGAVDAGGSTGATSGDDPHPFLDDNGHGSGSASVSAGNRYGYCPTCLIVMVEALDETVVAKLDWVDISSNSFGYVGGVPLGYALGGNVATKTSAERGQTTLFAAGNGVGNAFGTAPIWTYGSDQTGPDWTVTVGAIREDAQDPIVSDGIPVHISNLGDGDLPSACRTGTVGQCAFGGTSAATPYSAGVFGNVLTRIRDELGDVKTGQRDGQVVAKNQVGVGGFGGYVADGTLSRRELRAAVLKTAVPRAEAGSAGRYPFPWTYDGPARYLHEGYGVPGPASAVRATEVLLGLREMPARPDEDAYFTEDCANRDAQYSSFDRDGDGEEDGCDKSESVDEAFKGEGEPTNEDPNVDDFRRDDIERAKVLDKPITYFLHRVERLEPTRPEFSDEEGSCLENDNEQFLSRADSEGDVEPCFDSRVTSVPAAFRPKGIFAATDTLEGALPAGSTVDVTLFMQTREPTVSGVTAVLKATDREVGRSAEVQSPTHPAGWTEIKLTIETERHVAPGEQLTIHFAHFGNEAWAYGYEGDHASQFTITPAAPPAKGLEFGVTIDRLSARGVSGRVAVPDLGEDPQLAGFHPVITAVQISVGDPSFADPIFARLDRDRGTYEARLPNARGRTIYVRVLRDGHASATKSARAR